MKCRSHIAWLLALAASLSGCASSPPSAGPAEGLRRVDRYTLAAQRDLLRSVSPRNADGTINVIVENPAGTVQKWELSPDGRSFLCRLEGGKPHELAYLGYPANYGALPGTILPKALGGEGDPVDVIVLGPPAPRGAVLAARPVGLLTLSEMGRQDDKVLAVSTNSIFGRVKSLKELQRRFPGAAEIVRIWFEHRKGPGRVGSVGLADAQEAEKLITASMQAFELSGGQRGREIGGKP